MACVGLGKARKGKGPCVCRGHEWGSQQCDESGAMRDLGSRDGNRKAPRYELKDRFPAHLPERNCHLVCRRYKRGQLYSQTKWTGRFMTTVYIDPEHEPISLDDPLIPIFLRNMGSDQPLIEVTKAKTLLPIGNCYWNVDAMIKRHGGSAVYGWEVSVWSGSHIAAMHHAIWKTAEGELLDVTETYPSVRNKAHSTFLADDQFLIDLERSPNIPAVYFASPDPKTQEYVKSCRDLHALQKTFADILYDCGDRCERFFAKSQGKDPVESSNFSVSLSADTTLRALANQITIASQRLFDATVQLKDAT